MVGYIGGIRGPVRGYTKTLKSAVYMSIRIALGLPKPLGTNVLLVQASWAGEFDELRSPCKCREYGGETHCVGNWALRLSFAGICWRRRSQKVSSEASAVSGPVGSGVLCLQNQMKKQSSNIY